MLICPHCSFENPGQNRFCQQCGYALQVWRALIMPRLTLDPSDLGEGGQSTAADQMPLPASDRSVLERLFPQYPYLDDPHRYQFHQAGGPTLLPSEGLVASVIDCQPTLPSPLEGLVIPESDPESRLAQEDLPPSLPPAAVPYLALQNQLFPTVPMLHAAWETAECSVFLLEDRESWSFLGDMWQLGAVDPLQQLHWFYNMSEVWEALEEWHCQGSLLDSANLRVDEDQIFCLTYLQQDAPESVLTPAELGKIWQELIQPAQDTVPPLLVALINAVAAGQMAGISEVQSELVKLSDTFQTDQQADPAGDNQPSSTAGVLPNELSQPSILPEDLSADAPLLKSWPLPEDEDRDGFPVGEELEETIPADLIEDEDETLDTPTMVLPMKIVRLDQAGRTHVGRQRDHNEDFFCSQTELVKLEGPSGTNLSVKGMYILCDGMGGHASGEVASSLAVKTLQTYLSEHTFERLPNETFLIEAVSEANQSIYQINQEDARSGNNRMGTTLVMLMVQDNRAVVAHVGDSRLYTYTRRIGLKQVTVDHEVGQREIQRGVEPAIAYARPDAYQLTQALGPRSSNDLKPSLTFLDIIEDTLFILCSDGLSDNDLLEQYCSSHVEPLLHSQADLEEGVSQLIELANEYNGHDNITAILVRLKLRPNMDKLPTL